jgi:hypothetical protein
VDVEQAIAAVWESRASAEAGVHAYVTLILEDLRAIGADAKVIELATRMRADEERHVAICVDVASRYAGRPIATPPPRPFVDPLNEVPLPLRATLRVVSTCCIGETIASAWVDESARRTQPKWLHAILRKHLADEIVHARVGWAHLASVADRSTIAAWLPRLLQWNLNAWRSFDPRWPEDGFPEHGLPSHADTRLWVDDAIASLVLPGFDQLGIDTAAARAYLER